jgi:hypothetical protein
VASAQTKDNSAGGESRSLPLHFRSHSGHGIGDFRTGRGVTRSWHGAAREGWEGAGIRWWWSRGGKRAESRGTTGRGRFAVSGFMAEPPASETSHRLPANICSVPASQTTEAFTSQCFGERGAERG